MDLASITFISMCQSWHCVTSILNYVKKILLPGIQLQKQMGCFTHTHIIQNYLPSIDA